MTSNHKTHIANIKARLASDPLGMLYAIKQNEEIAEQAKIDARNRETEVKAKLREEHPEIAESMRCVQLSGMCTKSGGGAYHITAPGIDLKMGRFDTSNKSERGA